MHILHERYFWCPGETDQSTVLAHLRFLLKNAPSPSHVGAAGTGHGDRSAARRTSRRSAASPRNIRHPIATRRSHRRFERCGMRPRIMHMMSARPVLLCQHALGATRCGARLPVPSAEMAPQPAMKLTALRRASAPPRAPRAPPCRATRRTPAPPPIRQRPPVSPGASPAPRPSLHGKPRARP